jgi:tetratricopeptide (TPR) repeat protein
MAIANTAAALEALGRREEALSLYEQVLDIFRDLGEKEMRASILRRVSDLQLKTRRGYQAIASMEAALDQKEKPLIKDSVFKRVLTFLRKKLTG